MMSAQLNHFPQHPRHHHQHPEHQPTCQTSCISFDTDATFHDLELLLTADLPDGTFTVWPGRALLSSAPSPSPKGGAAHAPTPPRSSPAAVAAGGRGTTAGAAPHNAAEPALAAPLRKRVGASWRGPDLDLDLDCDMDLDLDLGDFAVGCLNSGRSGCPTGMFEALSEADVEAGASVVPDVDRNWLGPGATADRTCTGAGAGAPAKRRPAASTAPPGPRAPTGAKPQPQPKRRKQDYRGPRCGAGGVARLGSFWWG